MKSIIVFYNDICSKYSDEKVFSGKSARDLSKQWAGKLGIQDFTLQCTNLTELLEQMKALCQENSADFVIFSYNDLPFLNQKLTEQMIDSHTEYKSEYTFADGYPYGVSPELIDAGTIGILAEISRTNQKSLGDAPVSRDGIYNLIKTDINSFEVDAEIAPDEWRLYRFAFHCGKKENFMQCTALFNRIKDNIELSANEISKAASTTIGCLKTVPGFYNIQISDKVNSNYIYLPYKSAYESKYNLSPMKATQRMTYDNFSLLVDKIANFSECAVISLSAWGEPLTNPDILKMIEKVLSYDGLSVFMETDGLLITQSFVTELKKIVEDAAERTNGWKKIMIAVSLDAFTSKTYTELHEGTEEGFFVKAQEGIALLHQNFSDCVYPQFVRINENEEELESFYRFWNDKLNPSGGNLIIQKYEDFSGLLPNRKPADLSPLEKNPCWHIRRDMNILSNGDVTFCRNCVLSGIIGNVFESSLDDIWGKTDDVLKEHMNQRFKEMCESCDETYTYQF